MDVNESKQARKAQGAIMDVHTNSRNDEFTFNVSMESLARLEEDTPPPPNGWSYDLGQRVEHISGIGAVGTVAGRTASFKKNGEFAQEVTVVVLDEAPQGTGNVLYIMAEMLVPEHDD